MSEPSAPLNLPPGREALVGVDLCDLASLWNQDTTLASQVLGLYEPLAHTLLDDHGGRAIAVPGDREIMSFPNVDAALIWALRMQEALLAADWPDELEEAILTPSGFGQELVFGGLMTAMSLHVGDPLTDTDMVLAILDLTQPGQVLISEDTRALATMPSRSPDQAVQNLEAVQLLEGQARTHLVQVLPRSLGRRRFDPLLSRSRCPLRPTVDCFIGRRAAMEGLAERFESGGRLVSVVGSSGVGKSRLALEYAQATMGQWPGGTWFCALDDTRSPSDLLVSVAETLGATEGRAEIEPADLIAQAIRGLGEALIVLDGFDAHLDIAGQTLGHWVRSAPTVRFLVTARSAIELEWETRMSLAPMPEDEILTLLRARLRGAHRGTGDAPPPPDGLRALVAHCHGSPLAAELVAGQVFAQGLTPTLALLSQAAITEQAPASGVAEALWPTWSEPDRLALATVAQASGPVAKDGVVAVTSHAQGSLDSVTGLQIRRIVQAVPVGPPSRLTIAPAVASVANAAAPEGGPALATWLVETAETSGSTWVRRELSALVSLFHQWRSDDPELAVRIALCLEPALTRPGWAGIHADVLDAAVDLSTEAENPEMAARVRAARAGAHRAAGRCEEARSDFDAILSGDLAATDRAHALEGLGRLHWDQNDSNAALAAWQEARELMGATHTHDFGLLTLLAEGLRAQEDFTGAAEAAEAAIQAAEAAGDVAAAGRARGVRGRLHLDAGEIDLAARVLEPALAAASDANDRRGAAVIRSQLAEVALLQGRPETALTMYEQSATVLAQAGHRAMLAQVYGTIGGVHLANGQLEEADQALGNALPICRELGRGDIEAAVLARQGIVARARGDIDGALDAFAGAAALARDQADATLEGFVLAHRAAVEAAWDRLDAADQMFLDATARLEEAGDTMYLVILDVLGGFADLARARDAAAAGDADQETAHVDLALSRLARGTSHESRVTPPQGGENPDRLGDLRVALRLLDTALSALNPRELPPQ